MKVANKIKNMTGITLAVGFSLFVLFFVITCTWIGMDVKTKCFEARKQYGGSCVEALSRLLDDNRQGYRPRNSAIWALGQLGNNQALPILQRYYTGNIPEREPLDKTISQYELKKAIDLINSGKNMTAVFWRYSIQ